MKIAENDVKITSKEILRNKGMLKKLKIDSRHTLKCKNLATVQKYRRSSVQIMRSNSDCYPIAECLQPAD